MKGKPRQNNGCNKNKHISHLTTWPLFDVCYDIRDIDRTNKHNG